MYLQINIISRKIKLSI